MAHRLKALVTSSYPAPYRVGVFQELSKYFELEVFFDTCKNENRNIAWFCKSGALSFEVLDTNEKWRHFHRKLKELKQFEFVLAYDYTRRPSRKAIWECHLQGVPYFLNCDGVIPHSGVLRNLVKFFVYPFLFKGATACFASGLSAIRNYKKYGVSPEKIFTHNFTSLTEDDILGAPISEHERCTIRQELGLPAKPLVLTVGQFIPRKGFDILLLAWKRVDFDATLLLIGGGDERPVYERLIRENQLRNVIIRDFMPKAEVFRHYQAADLFVLPTREDIWGLVVNEAMSQGLPVITTDHCVAGVELIKENENGYVVRTGSEEELALRIQHLLVTPKDRSRMSANNVQKMAGWTMANVARRHFEVIRKTLLGD